jgi:type II secretory pathway pseudopilin PulG
MRSGSRDKRQLGFTYIAALILVALLGGGLAAYGELATHARQRESEAQLQWVGNQFREAIGLYYQRTPGSAKQFPQKLEDMLEDRRFLSRQRYLRRIYDDPLTGKSAWGLIMAPEGGITGVYSLAEGRPIRSGLNGETASYRDFRFIYTPPATTRN